MINTQLVISINVHEKVDFFLKQLANISEFVKIPYEIILNCNEYMYNELKQINLENVHLNPIIINKQWNHGSLAKGIFENMKYAKDNFTYEMFLVMSSRELFYRILESINQIKECKITENSSPWKIYTDYDINGWGWAGLKPTLLFQKIKENNLKFSQSPHEGMVYEYNTVNFIIEFMDKDELLKENTFNHNQAMEEWALQSISVNHSGYYYIGNGCYNKTVDGADKSRFTLKQARV